WKRKCIRIEERLEEIEKKRKSVKEIKGKVKKTKNDKNGIDTERQNRKTRTELPKKVQKTFRNAGEKKTKWDCKNCGKKIPSNHPKMIQHFEKCQEEVNKRQEEEFMIITDKSTDNSDSSEGYK